MTDQEKMQYIQYMQLKDELDDVAYTGIQLKLDGNYANAHIIASECVFREESDYMRDYRRGDNGKISELSFEKIRPKKEPDPEDLS